MNELWKDIIGYEGVYQISNKGKIRSLDRLLNTSNNSFRSCKGQFLKTKLDKYGYLAIGLSCNQHIKWYTIHRLVSIVFIPNPENKPTVNHKDGNKQNNNDWNLEWNTWLENSQHAVKTGLREGAVKVGEDNNLAKLKEKDVLFIRENYNKKSCNLQVLADKFHVSVSNISQIKNHKHWKHI